MARLKIGDVFEITTTKGKGYFQYVHKDEMMGQLIRLLPNLYEESHIFESELVKEKEMYLVHFPLGSALEQKVVRIKGNYEVPRDFVLPKKFRSKHTIKGEFVGWHIIDYETLAREKVQELTNEQKQLSPWGTWNDTLLKERMEHGWTLNDWT
ncbi:hypothetical protein [Alkalihalobacillus sp. AL-G]|uniref:hypothetical protein n=1 Tax=Alkalihalobacillus sp. AL-G TaxID=2926399 RepID=UPI00272D11B0|nr:hypothetical protein [Alkalihalobacillus sp. AL-G]WLD93781.1 hypothetical protein MOJ78_02375 [Alkalihalobacillus sp. AL-G]